MKITVPALLRIKPNALEKVGKYLCALDIDHVAVLYADGLSTQLHEQVESSCRQWKRTITAVQTVTSNETRVLFDLSLNLPENTGGLMVLGGGRAIDAGKYLSHMLQIPLLVCPTIVSNDGVASPFSSLLFDGVKRTVRTRLPAGIVVDTAIVAQAPVQFYYSGVGDLVSNLTAIADWKAAYHHHGLYVDDFAVSVSQTAAENFIHSPETSPIDYACLRTLANGLILSGIAMEVAGSSRPASGSEHLISHAYDTLPESQASLHGLQVGVAAYAVSAIQEKTHKQVRQCLLDSGFVDYMKHHPLSKQAFLTAVQKAPRMKENFYTLLSESDSMAALLDFVHRDALLNEMLAE